MRADAMMNTTKQPVQVPITLLRFIRKPQRPEAKGRGAL
jgi:hypothetical protein